MITPDGWFDWMIKDLGPRDKLNGGRNPVHGCVPHSAEGYWPFLRVLLHRPERRASWFASNLKDGRCFQHYSIYDQTWTSGAGFPNNNFVAWENEGVAGEAFTDAQVANCVRIIKEVSELGGWEPRRPLGPQDKAASLYEHNECVRWGADPTACPSGRVPWDRILSELEDDMAITLVACGDAPGGFRLYALGQGSPMWILDPKAATDLKATFGEPKGISWAALKSLGA